MKARVLAVEALSVLALIGAFGSNNAEAKIAKCYFSVNGTIVINGACRFEFENGDGSFSFDDMKMKTRCQSNDLGSGQCTMASTVVTIKGAFGRLQITSPGRANIYWNEGVALHAQAGLPPVTRNGACWQNSTIKLCAW